MIGVRACLRASRRLLFWTLAIWTFILQGLFQAFPTSAGQNVSPFGHSAASVLNCVRDCNSLLIPVEINGRTCMMLFDTGAENITISRKQLYDLGLSAPSGKTNGAIQGIGAAPVVAWKSSATVKVGKLVCENFPLNVDEQNYMHPIIGRNFFKNCAIKVDPIAAQITLIPAGSSVSHGALTVPLARAGSQLLIPVCVNGKSVSMLFDTGADGITFNEQQASATDLKIPADARRELHLGVAGLVEGLGFTVSEIRLGPIVKQNVKVSVIKSPGMPYPLLGGDYFRDSSYTIDEEHSELAFER
jgi:predicted aspartyl protease